MNNPDPHAAIVATALRRLRRIADVEPASIRLLAGGLSGAAVYAFDHHGAAVVLKVTPPGVGAGLLRRARQEALFYRDLAARVPVQVPRALGRAMDAGGGVAILLEAHAPAPPAAEWLDEDFAEVARKLGALHAAFWGAPSASTIPAWLPLRPTVTPERCRNAADQWRAIGEQPELRAAIGPVRRRIDQMLANLPALDRRNPTVPVTLCHGDFHAGNLLRSAAGNWLLADWQDAHLGPGVDDLSFLWQRAVAAGDAAPPYDTIAGAYLDALHRAAIPPLDPARLDRALAWSELRSSLVDWPFYLGSLPTPRAARIIDRIALLIDRGW